MNAKLYKISNASYLPYPYFGQNFIIFPLEQIRHRLRGSASPVLTATHHSYGSRRLSDFFPTALEIRPLNRFSRKMAQTTCIHARMCLLQ